MHCYRSVGIDTDARYWLGWVVKEKTVPVSAMRQSLSHLFLVCSEL